MSKQISTLALINILFAMVGASLYAYISAQNYLVEDRTYITWLIVALLCVGVSESFRAAGKSEHQSGSWQNVRWIANSLVYLGLIGTVVGFIIALSSMDPSETIDAEYLRQAIPVLISGMGTALQTTLAGAIGYLWLSTGAYIAAKEDI